MSTPAVRDLEHLWHIVRDEMERAKREGQSALHLEGCLESAHRRLVDEVVGEAAGGDPGCRVLAAGPTPWGYAVSFCRDDGPPPDLIGDDVVLAVEFR